MKSGIYKTILTSFLIILMSSAASAELPASLRVYTTHGDINTLYEAFLKISLIASDSRYIGLCYAFLILSFIVSAYAVFGGKGVVGQINSSDMIGWFLSFLVACVILRAFIITKSDITIDDVTMNQTVTIPDIPDGIALLVNGMNLVENAIVEIVSTAGTPDGFIVNPGGAGLNILSKMFGHDLNIYPTGPGNGIKINLQNYAQDCVSYAIATNTITISELSQNTNLLNMLAKANHPSLPTKNASGDALWCSELYTEINNYFVGLNDTHPDVNRWIDGSCSEAGWFDKAWGAIPVLGAIKINTCRDNGMSLLSYIIDDSFISATNVFSQIMIAEELYLFSTSADTDIGVTGLGNYNQGNSMVSAGLLSAEWMPQIKAMMLAAFLGLIPILLVFLASTMWKKILGFTIGCLVFFTAWNICDVVMHDFAMSKALAVLKDLRNEKLSIKNILLFSSESMKAYAVFGQYKVWSMGLAVFFSGALVKGGSELGRIAAGRTSDMKSAGDAASADMTDPVRNASKREGLASAVPTQALYNSNAYDAMSRVAEYNKKVGAYGPQAIMNGVLGGPGHTPETAAQNTARGKAYTVTSNVSAADALDAVSGQTGQSGYDLLAKNATVNLAKTSGEAQAYSDEGGGSIAGVVDLARRAGSFDVGEKLSKMGAYEKGAALTGKSVRGLQNEAAGVAAAKTIQDAASFRESAAKHYGPGDQGMYDMAKDFARVNNETGVGRNQALRDVAEKHYGGAGNIAAAEKDLQTFNRLKNVADKKAHDSIMQKHFGGDPDKMYSAMALASVASASGDAVARQHVADNYFHGDQFDMDRAASLYKNTSEAAKNKALGKGLESVAAGGGKHAAGKAMGEKKVVDTVGTGGVASTGAASEYGKQAGSIWNSLVESMVNGRAMPRGMRQTLKDMMANPHSREQLNANGKGISVAMPNDKRKAIEFGKKIGMSEADAASMAGSQITVSGGVDEKGRLYFTTKDSQKGDSVSTYTNRKNEAAGVLEAFRSGSYANLNPYSERLITASMNQADRTLDGKGGAALSREVRAIASQLTDEIQKSGYSRTGSREGSLNASASADVGLRVPGIGGGGVGLDYRDGSSDRETYNLVATDIQRNIRRAVNESGNNTDALSRNLDKYVGSFIRETLGETQSKKPTDFGGETIIDSGAGDIEKFKRDLKR